MNIYLKSFKELYAKAKELDIPIFGLDTLMHYKSNSGVGFVLTALCIPPSPARFNYIYSKQYSNRYTGDRVTWRQTNAGTYLVHVDTHVGERQISLSTLEEVQAYVNKCMEDDKAEKEDLDFILSLLEEGDNSFVLISKFSQ